MVHGIAERVSDGDTFKIRTAVGTVVLRLAAIEAPKARQPFGRAASRYFAKICLGNQADSDVRKEGQIRQDCGQAAVRRSRYFLGSAVGRPYLALRQIRPRAATDDAGGRRLGGNRH